jgi:hypothetical protein
MALTARDILLDAGLFRRTYPDWPSGPSMSAADLTDYPESLDSPRPEGAPSRTALRMAALLRGVATARKADR